MGEIAIFNFILLWVVLSVVVGVYSDRKGGSFISGFLIALVTSPLLAALILAARKPLTSEIEKREIESGEMKKCPACAELIKCEAIKCRFCGEDVSASIALPNAEIKPPARTGWQGFLFGKENWR